jgi:3-oxo-5-alpha-steroid 4-dehydrogenase 1
MMRRTAHQLALHIQPWYRIGSWCFEREAVSPPFIMNLLSDDALLWSWIALAVLVFPVLFLVSAPYGRHLRTGWGPTLRSDLGWIIQESPSFLIMALYLTRWLRPRTDKLLKLGFDEREWMTVTLAFCWLVHYANRAFVFPLRMRGGSKPTTFTVVSTAILFCVINTYLNAKALFVYELVIRSRRSLDWAFCSGLLLWVCGLIGNWHSDAITRALRRNPEEIKEKRYAIPYGGLYRYVSAPNYFSEFVEWTGFAIAAQTWAAFSFALWTFSNLYPRARSNHQWYLENFAEYKSLNRNAFFPNPLKSAAVRARAPQRRGASSHQQKSR